MGIYIYICCITKFGDGFYLLSSAHRIHVTCIYIYIYLQYIFSMVKINHPYGSVNIPINRPMQILWESYGWTQRASQRSASPPSNSRSMRQFNKPPRKIIPSRSVWRFGKWLLASEFFFRVSWCIWIHEIIYCIYNYIYIYMIWLHQNKALVNYIVSIFRNILLYVSVAVLSVNRQPGFKPMLTEIPGVFCQDPRLWRVLGSDLELNYIYIYI